jgi:glycosyltransferase involved in cell wall biosynthesis
MHKSRIAILTGIYPPDSGGPATFAVSFSQFVRKQGFTSKVISLTDGPSKETQGADETIKLISRDLGLLKRSLVVSLQILFEFLQKSHVIANGFFVETYLASILLRGKYTAKVPGDIVWERAINSGKTNSDVKSFQSHKLNTKYKLFRFLFSRSLLRAKNVVVPSPLLFELCLNWGVSPSRLHLVYNSVDTDYFKPGINSILKFDCIAVNRLVELKNVDQIIIACNNLNLSLLIVGDGPEMGNLTSLSRELNAKTFFAGNASQAEIRNYLQSSSIYILNSTVDATAYSLLEARSCGLITIANIETGASEVITDLKDGYLTKSTTHQEVEAALKWVISRAPREISEIREASRVSTLRLFNRDLNFTKILELTITK